MSVVFSRVENGECHPICRVFEHKLPLFQMSNEYSCFDSLIQYLVDNRESIVIVDDKNKQYTVFQFLHIILAASLQEEKLKEQPFSAHNIYLDKSGASWINGGLY